MELFNTPKVFGELLAAERGNEAFIELLRRAQTQYMAWDKFQYQTTPNNISSKHAWQFLRYKRQFTAESTPISSEKHGHFMYSLTKEHLRMMRLIDSQASGSYMTDVDLPAGTQQSRYVLNGLIEEAINSSQLEGASTTRKVAKEMIQQGRAPKNDSERMIFNNYVAMQKAEEWTKRKLDQKFLLEIHSLLTEDILPKNETGKFRKDSDEVVVSDPVTNEIFHRAPPTEFLLQELPKLYAFANAQDEYHPVTKAILLHFWIGYLHPFTDGNGRTARVIFYWYLLKHDYWLFKFVTTSKIIKASKKAYGMAYVHSEQHDELDLGYFVQYILRTTLLAIDDFKAYLKRKKLEEEKALKKFSGHEINDRQREMLTHLAKSSAEVTIEQYQARYRLVYETARRDLRQLEAEGLVTKRKSGKKFLYVLN